MACTLPYLVTIFWVILAPSAVLSQQPKEQKWSPEGDFKYLIEGKDPKSHETCFYWYTELINGALHSSDGQSTTKLDDFIVETEATKATVTVECPKIISNNNQNIKRGTAKLTFKSNSGTELTFDLTFTVFVGGHWELDESVSKITYRQYTFKLGKNYITAGNNFSFSCTEMDLRTNSITAEKGSKITLQLGLKRFQIQPYPQMNPKWIFYDSFDCTTWFTIPLWQGFSISFLLTAILAIGVYALVSIKTPDRFENPKGKTITVTASE